MRCLTIAVTLSLACCTAPPLAAQAPQVRFFQENGVTFRETREVVDRPVTQVKTEERKQTVLQPQTVSQVHSYQYQYYEPLTTYRWQAELHGRLNPFIQPYYAWRLVPVTQWQPRTGTVQYPQVCQQWVPAEQTVQVTTRELGFQKEERVSRVAMATPTPAGPSTAVAGRSSFTPAAPDSRMASRGLPNNLRTPSNLPVAPRPGTASVAGGADATPSLAPRGKIATGALPVAPARPAVLGPAYTAERLGGLQRLDGDDPTRSRDPLTPSQLR